MNTFVKFLDEKLSQPMARLSTQRHLQAVRDGIIATLPLIIVGSFFLIIAAPPLPAKWEFTKMLQNNAGTILLPYRVTVTIMSVYAAFGIGYSLSESYKLDGLSGGILATIAFLSTIIPINVPADVAAAANIPNFAGGWHLPANNLGGAGMFVAIVTSLLAVEIFRLADKSGFKIKMPDAVPPSVARSFEALVPTALVMVIFGSITYFIGFRWHEVMMNLVRPLVNASDSLLSVLILVLLITLFWSFGIHGVSIVGTLARPIWLVLFQANTDAAAAGVAGNALPAIAAEPFFQWFIWIGGSGATIGLALAMAFFSKSAYLKALGKTGLAPALFNINEPIIFGAPIVLNPILIVPFITAPMIMATIAWFATSLGFVNRVVVTAPWTLPGPIGAFLATKDWRAAVLSVILILISFAIYYPFFKIYDGNLLKEEQEGTQ